MLNSKLEAEGRKGGVKHQKHGPAQVCRKCAASYCCRERERVVVYIEAGGLIMGGMEECALGGREKGRKGRAHGSTNLWGRPIRGWMTSVLPASKSCATRQPTCRRSMNV